MQRRQKLRRYKNQIVIATKSSVIPSAEGLGAKSAGNVTKTDVVHSKNGLSYLLLLCLTLSGNHGFSIMNLEFLAHPLILIYKYIRQFNNL
jgi:hypothetical protein